MDAVDLSAAERIVNSALVCSYDQGLARLALYEINAAARVSVAALSAAGWLVTPVEREPVPPLLAIDTATGRVEQADRSQG